MEITKGYTSLGFGLYLKSLTTKEFCELSGAELPYFRKNWTTEQNALGFMRIDAIKLRMRDDWDKKLLQTISIDQFINQIPKPNNYNANQNPLSVDESKEWKEYLEGEKKVIFKGWKLIEPNLINITISASSSIQIFFMPGVICYEIYSGLDTHEGDINTIGDLFRITNGELELQNVEI